MTTKTKKVIGTSLLSVVAAAVLVTGLYIAWLRIPPAMPNNLDEAAAVLGSARFQRLTADRKLAYAERMRELAMQADEAQRQAFWEKARDDKELQQQVGDLMREQLVQRARLYALASESERDQMIFEMMAQFQQMSQQWRQQNQQGQGGQRPDMTDEERAKMREERRNEMVNSMEQTAATGNPQDQQLVVEMFQSIRDKFGGMRGGR